MGMAERRKREKKEMRRNILDTAMALFVEEGYDQVSIRRIAEKIEYSPATIYLYFKDRNEILYCLHEEGFDELLRLQEEAMNISDPYQRLLELGEVYVKFALENREYYDLMFIMKGPMRKVEEEWHCGLETFDNLKKTVQDCAEVDYIERANIDVVAFSIWAHVHGMCSLIIRDRLPMFDESLRPDLIKGVFEFMEDKFLKK